MSSPESIRSQVGDVESPSQSNSTTFATQIPGGLPPTTARKFYSGANVTSMLLQHLSNIKDTTKHPQSARLSYGRHSSAVLQPVLSERAVEISSRISAKNNERHGQAGHEKQAKNVHQSPSYGDRMPSHESEKENSQESLKREGQLMTNQKPVAEVVNLEFEKESIAEPAALKSPFEGLTRVPKAYVRIPDDQRALLESSDSWITTENSSRTKFANLPSKVLESLTAFNDGLMLPDLGKAYLSNESFASTNAESDVNKESEEGSIAEVTHGSAASKSQSFEDAETVKSSEPVDADITDRDDVLSWSASPDRDIPASHRSHSPTRTLDPSHQAQDTLVPSSMQSSPSERCRDPPRHKSGSYGASRRYVRETSQELRQRKQEDEVVLYDPGATDQRLISMGTPVGSSEGEHLYSSRRVVAGASAAVEHVRGQSRILNSGIAPSSSPVEEIELAVPHAINEALDDVLEMRDHLAAHLLFPATAFHGRQQIQVEQTPIPDPQMQDTHGDRQQRSSKRSHMELSSDPVIPATFIELSSQDHISFSDTSGAMNTETDLQLSKCRSKGVEIQVCRSNGDDDSLQNQLQNEFETSHRMVEKVIHTSLTKASDSDSLNHRGSGARAKVKKSEGNLVLSPQSQAPQHQASVAYHVPSSNVEVQNPTLPPAPARQSPSSGQSTPRKRRRLKNEHATSLTDAYFVRDTREMARANRRAFQASLSIANEDALSAKNELILPAKPLPLDSDNKDNNAPNIIGQQAKGSVWQLSAKTSSHPQALQQANAPRNQNVTGVPVTLMLFDEYKAAYPSFIGDRMGFLKALVYIEWLGKRAPHKTLWDDFVRTFCQDFPAYIASCRALNKTPKTGIDFYNDEIDPVFHSRVITPHNLQSGLCYDSEDVNLIRRQFHKSRTAKTSLGGLSQFEAKDFVPEDHEAAPNDPHNARNDIASDTSGCPMPEIRSMAGNKRAKSKPFFETASQINAAAISTGGPEIFVDDDIKTPRMLPWPRDVLQASDARSTKPQQGSHNGRHKAYVGQSSGSPILGREREESITRSQSKSDIEKTLITSTRAGSDPFGLSVVSRSKTLLRRTTSLPQARKDSIHGIHGQGSSTPTSTPGSVGRNVSFDLFVRYKASRNGFSSATSSPHSKASSPNRNSQKNARSFSHQSLADGGNVYFNERGGPPQKRKRSGENLILSHGISEHRFHHGKKAGAGR